MPTEKCKFLNSVFKSHYSLPETIFLNVYLSEIPLICPTAHYVPIYVRLLPSRFRSCQSQYCPQLPNPQGSTQIPHPLWMKQMSCFMVQCLPKAQPVVLLLSQAAIKGQITRKVLTQPNRDATCISNWKGTSTQMILSTT